MDYFHLCAGQDTMEQISVLGLAHLGDGVYELMVRAWLCLHGKATNKGLHRAAVTYVSAPAQAQRAQKKKSGRYTIARQNIFWRSMI